MQTTITYAPSTPSIDTKSPSPTVATLTRAERKSAFAIAIKNGASIIEASRLVGISRNAGSRWAAQVRQENQLDSTRPLIISKNQLAETLSGLVQSEDVDPRDKINASKALSDVLGYNAPTKSIVETRIVHPSTLAWLESEDYIDATVETPMLTPAAETRALPASATGGGPPKANDVDAVQSPPKYLPDSSKVEGS